MHAGHLYITETGMSAASMRKAVPPLVNLAVKLSRRQDVGPADEEGYLPRGYRRNAFHTVPAYKRAIDMLHKKIAGQPYISEVPLEQYTQVPPAPAVKDLKSAKAALVSEDGLVPKGNDQRLTSAMCNHLAVYSFQEHGDFQEGEYEVIHGGFDARPVLADRNRQLPLDVLRDLQKNGEIKEIFDRFLVTVGNSNSIENCTKIGQEMAEKLKEAGVAFAILPAT
jgi:glycine reductase